jgi:hypothetical protein
LDFSQEICNENFLNEIKEFSISNFIHYKDLELIKNKTNSKWLIKYLTENSNFYKEFLTKKIKLPNLKNFYFLIRNKNNNFSSFFSYGNNENYNNKNNENLLKTHKDKKTKKSFSINFKNLSINLNKEKNFFLY